jgi:TonB family protein
MIWWQYLLLVNIYLLLFYGFYVLLLSKETFFQLNRIYLVSAALLSFFIPLIQSNWVQNLFITQQVKLTLYSSPVMVYQFNPVQVTHITIGQVVVVIYLIGIAFLTSRFIAQMIVLKKLINQPDTPLPYSFFRKIKLSDNETKNQHIIAAHEHVHARQWHSADVLLIEAIMIVNWFNPIVYLYRFSIKHIHEYIADRQALKAGATRADYALLLLSQTFNTPVHELVNPFFNHSLLKQRIMMLQKNKSQRIALIKYGLSAPLFGLMLVLSSATINNSKTIRTINKKAQQVFLAPADTAIRIAIQDAEINAPKKDADGTKTAIKSITIIPAPIVQDTIPHKTDKVFTEVEKVPEFPGGVAGFYKFLAQNIKYPAEMKSKGIQGREIISFIVEEDGSLSNIHAVRSLDPTADEETIRVMALSPKWIPGMQNGSPVRTSYSVPVSYTLADDKTQNKTGEVKEDNNKVFTAVEQVPGFPGGINAFYEFLAHNIKYPDNMKKKGIQGREIVSFVVEKDGSLSDIKIARSIDPTADEETLRVMALSPKWNPGVQNGKTVRVAYAVPISYTLAK